MRITFRNLTSQNNSGTLHVAWFNLSRLLNTVVGAFYIQNTSAKSYLVAVYPWKTSTISCLMLYNLQIYESFDYCQHVTSNNMSHSSLYVFKGVNTLPAAYLMCFNLQWYYPYIPIQMQLSRKQKTFCLIFSAFLKSSLNF